MGTLTLDASIVIGFFRRGDAHHESARTALAAARSRDDHFVLPASVFSEVLAGGYRAGTAAEMRRRLLGLFGPVRVVDEEVADTAARLRATHRSLRLPDALVIATGIAADGVVLTCDDRLGPVDDRVQVLAAGP